ncbi:MAG: D-tyrosyl-tRNA(Tyr) deacylase [Bacteroidetes bacterium GWE2_39_28]|nr:MAG: D-tyrosyl-tRNA(Tyr) deacylase [Bacteroidetes bacterium GWE2_39_28]OFY15147.1 MAG: D-tyrosyl-tRNA(Tyr) deacylase [Bacteroidetes bacterium GWF2_39_10]OFZ08321.1 MAG: D-tyrosyl-tRNA(Tyr) deacylase [Bacteroidetes bacterium RIFOXYB2_FULL_39_7]OFZ10987.1 MAG: D-tyrosyl-tRNA(Tyr) deacylase [Bacteroidetes bacterium RIFOXYC2_FULL_39_11]HCT93767.1 D-tyrosyl-tRNA(Tyr) deacylase [Rikenellaceae bacterium]
MRILIQRVTSASVISNGLKTGEIGEGLLLLVGFEESDTLSDIDYAVRKCTNLRIFDDEAGVMNLSVIDTNGDILIVSQFTLHAITRKGNRPSYIKAAKPDKAIPLYESFISAMNAQTSKNCPTGIFGADMKVSLVNDGPVTIWIDTKEENE